MHTGSASKEKRIFTSSANIRSLAYWTQLRRLFANRVKRLGPRWISWATQDKTKIIREPQALKITFRERPCNHNICTPNMLKLKDQCIVVNLVECTRKIVVNFGNRNWLKKLIGYGWIWDDQFIRDFFISISCSWFKSCKTYIIRVTSLAHALVLNVESTSCVATYIKHFEQLSSTVSNWRQRLFTDAEANEKASDVSILLQSKFHTTPELVGSGFAVRERLSAGKSETHIIRQPFHSTLPKTWGHWYSQVKRFFAGHIDISVI